MANNYKTLNVVGRGMTSQVYKGQNAAGKIVAIKELLPEHRKDPKRLKDLEDEVALMRTLKHPNLMGLIDYDKAKFRVVMEFMPRSLRQVIDKEPFHYVRRLRIALEVTEALNCLHAQKIIHKDIKPENIFLGEDGHAKLSDFGFAEKEAGLLSRFFGKRRIQGTIAYLSPEQVKQAHLTVRSDIFSWGTVMYEMFVGKRPFQSSQEQVMGKGGAGDAAALSIVKHILKSEPQAPRELNGELDKELENLIMHCLDKKPEHRPTAMNIKVTLQRALGKLR